MSTSIYSLSDSGACARYQQLWERAGGIFASLAYAKAAGSVFGLRPRICLHENAALLVHTKGAGIFRRIVVPACTQYSALLLPGPVPAHLIHRQMSPLDLLLQDTEQISHRADLLVPLLDPRTAQWRGWEVRPLFTYLIPLPARTENWSGGARRMWKSKVSEYEIREDAGGARQVIELCAKSYRRHGRTLPARPAALEALAGAMGEWARIFIAVRDRTPEAGFILLHDGQTAHYWIAGSLPGPAMTVLIGEVLPILSQSGITQFDFVGANTPSIAEFKRSFNPVLTPYYHLRRRPRIHPGH